MLLARWLYKTHRNCTITARSSRNTVDLYASMWPQTTRFNTRRDYSSFMWSLATASAQQMHYLLWEGWYYCFWVNQHWARVRCVSFDQKTKGDRATVRKFLKGRPWFSSSNSSNVRCHSCCHIVRPAACIGSWLYWTYLLRLIVNKQFFPKLRLTPQNLVQTGVGGRGFSA